MGFFDFLFQKPVCCECGEEPGYVVTIGYQVNDLLAAGQEKKFCLTHGVVEFSRLLTAYPDPIIFGIPEIHQVGGSFFYRPEDLYVRGYDRTDKEGVESMLADLPKGPSGGWVRFEYSDGEGGSRHIRPSAAPMEVLTREEQVRRIAEILTHFGKVYAQGEYRLTEPRGTGGVYLFDDQI